MYILAWYRTPVATSDISLDRLGAARGDSPVGFVQVFRQLRGNLKVWLHGGTSFQEAARLWSVQFTGERAIDAGGPYRESISYIVGDLMVCSFRVS